LFVVAQIIAMKKLRESYFLFYRIAVTAYFVL